MTLADAVKSAVTAQDKQVDDQTPKDDKAAPATDDKKVSEAPKDNKDDKPKEGELTETQLAEAKELYTKIMSPESGPGVIDWLARQAGYTKSEVKEIIKSGDKDDKVELKDDVLDALKEALGPELEFLTAKLAPALNKIIDTKFEKSSKDIRESIQAKELTELEQQSASTYSSLSKEYFNTDEPSKEFTQTIDKLIDEMPPSKGLKLETYMRNLFDIAIVRLKLNKFDAKSDANRSRANNNRNDAASRLASDRGSRSQTPIEIPKTRMSLDEAVRKAAQDVSEKLSKEN